ncbi:triacylglycerol lipase OBL1-like [Trifolium pratense]|uniref:triacylglycerol lipase OBL1-like n=1 Tax=Trifolium pratense TaxID=57577 RepID=UPI001E690BA1|nr:triacylglycerol lipase OBL1-like [Trifolium pratense]
MDHSSDKFAATGFLFLQPKNIGFFELFRVYFGTTKLHKENFVQCNEVVEEESLDEYKSLVFVSLLLQKLMLLFKYPLKYLGFTIELFFNLASGNCNIFQIISNLLQGKELVDTNSADYVSIIGHLDNRVELDKRIQRDDPKYNVALSMMTSKAAYENQAFIRDTVENHWKMEVVASGDYWNDFEGEATTQAYVLLNKSDNHDTYIVTFRGTEFFDADQWSCDFDISWLELPSLGKTHAGFMKALGLQKSNMGWPKEIDKNNHGHAPEAYYFIRDLLKKHLDGNDKAKFIVTGHSLGGALAILFPAILILHEETFLLERLEGVYTFGQPRVGGDIFSKYMEKNLKENGVMFYRIVYSYDIVPRLPPDYKDILFRHFGTCLYYDRNYNCKKMQEEPNKNYFSLSEIIPMSLNAFCELIRSFFMVSRYGSEYQEGWLLRIFRLVGLVIPGASNHIPQDYVNATRLGSIPSKMD